MAEVLSPLHNKGLNLLASDEAFPDEASTDSGNVWFGAGGKMFTRNGSTSAAHNFPAAAGASLELAVFEDTTYAGIGRAQLVFTGGRIYRMTNTPSGVDSPPVSVGTYTVPVGATVARRPQAVRFTDTQTTPPAVTPYTIAVFGESPPQAISALATAAVVHADWTALNGYPRAVAAYGSRVWYACSTAFPSRLWVTDVGKATTFTSPAVTSADSFSLDMELIDGGEIIAIQHLYDILLVFTNRGIYRIVTTAGATTPYKAQFVSQHVLAGPHALARAEGAVYFLTGAGVFVAKTTLTYGDIQAEEVSISIAPLFEQTAAWQLSGAVMTYDTSKQLIHLLTEHNYVFVSASTQVPVLNAVAALALLDAGQQAYPPSCTEVLTYDVRAQQWMRSYFETPIDFIVARDQGAGSVAIEAYHRTSTLVLTEHVLFAAGVTTDSAVAFPSYFRSKVNAYQSLALRKTRMFVDSHVRSGSPTLSASVDKAAFVVSGVLASGYSRRPITGSGRSLQVEYSGATPWAVDSFSTNLNAGGRR